ncbi:DUF2249 domain-containing protein [Demequina flava]|uniref:DUF2249 domain-containing protein n=1 Tax=Demequina flava TaxID=1095025 RepID=UPI0007824739|nr:DUF2249 domain-containing protein [Demequina flava]
MRIAYDTRGDAEATGVWGTVVGVDEIDLVALGHMPGGPRGAHASTPRDLDVRGLPERAAHVRVLAQVAVLVPGESITVTADADPHHLLDLVHDEVPGFCMFEYREHEAPLWRVSITRVTV